MKITIPLAMKPGYAQVEVTGELLLNLAPHLAHVASWIVHRDVTVTKKWWHVTNIESGRYVDFGKTKHDAIGRASGKLSLKTESDMLRAYREYEVK